MTELSANVISQYMNGTIPLNMKALLKLCHALEVSAQNVYPEMFLDIDTSIFLSDREQAEILDAYKKAPPRLQEAIKYLLKIIPE